MNDLVCRVLSMLNAVGLLRCAIMSSFSLCLCVSQIKEHTEAFNDMRAISANDDIILIGISPAASYAVFLAAGVSGNDYF